ncbi:MAG: hypothetical protein EZS28_047602, partial [Streblomastix strix]
IALTIRREFESEADISKKIRKDEQSRISAGIDIRSELQQRMRLNARRVDQNSIKSLVDILLKLGPQSLQVGASSSLETIENIIYDLSKEGQLTLYDRVNTLLALGISTGRARYILGASYDLLCGT